MIKRLAFLALFPLFLWSVGRVLAQPPQPPHAFQGTVSLDGAAPANGTVITAIVTHSITESVTFSTTTFANGVYGIDVAADDGDTSAYDGGINGDAVTFEISGTAAVQTATFSSMSITTLNLTAAAPATEHAIAVDGSGNLNINLNDLGVSNDLTLSISGANLLIEDPDGNLPGGRK